MECRNALRRGEWDGRRREEEEIKTRPEIAFHRPTTQYMLGGMIPRPHLVKTTQTERIASGLRTRKMTENEL